MKGLCATTVKETVEREENEKLADEQRKAMKRHVKPEGRKRVSVWIWLTVRFLVP